MRCQNFLLLLIVCELFFLFTRYTLRYPEESTSRLLNGVRFEAQTDLTGQRSHTHGPGCQALRHVYFMKTHKCGSTTVQRIFLRRAMLHNLTTVFADVNAQQKTKMASTNIHASWMFKASYVLPHPSGAYDVFCLHARFNAPEVARIMPSNTKYVSVLREPSQAFASAYNYYNMQKYMKVRLETFVSNPRAYAKPGMFARNMLLYDAGLSFNSFDDRDAITAKIEEIQKQFDLIIIDSYFDEGLILLKDLMCWSLEDVAVLDTNIQSAPKPVDPQLKLKLDEWNFGDVMYYEHFKSIMISKIKSFGNDRMKRQVQRLKVIRKNKIDRCVKQMGRSSDIKNILFKPYGNSKGYILKPEAEKDEECRILAMGEIQLLTVLRDKQYGFNATDTLWKKHKI